PAWGTGHGARDVEHVAARDGHGAGATEAQERPTEEERPTAHARQGAAPRDLERASRHREDGAGRARAVEGPGPDGEGIPGGRHLPAAQREQGGVQGEVGAEGEERGCRDLTAADAEERTVHGADAED